MKVVIKEVPSTKPTSSVPTAQQTAPEMITAEIPKEAPLENIAPITETLSAMDIENIVDAETGISAVNKGQTKAEATFEAELEKGSDNKEGEGEPETATAVEENSNDVMIVENEGEVSAEPELRVQEDVSAKESTNSAVSDTELSRLKQEDPLAALKLMLSLSTSSADMVASASTSSLSSINQESTEGLLRQLKTKVLEGNLVLKIEQDPSECFEIKTLLQKLHKAKPDQALLAFLVEFGPFFEGLCVNITKHSTALKHKDQIVKLHQQEINSLKSSQEKIDALEAQATKDEAELAHWDSKIQRFNEEMKILQTKLANAEYQKSLVQERMGAPLLSKKQAEAVEAIKHLDNANQYQVTIAQLNEELGYRETTIALSVRILDRLKASLNNL